ncbi:hypothetical protein NX862_08510 [Rhodobacter sp. KR11]|uniref:hypothetical protein n=1 Tax=Rhodobacter sp. KR11 TaxID=2974588 RepID=UPI002223A188|nr:hypothetical protein [Rhodobacter sp. KR11]MCW1918794.1 hypothetical protein [Rhodobacter sp. KR11]
MDSLDLSTSGPVSVEKSAREVIQETTVPSFFKAIFSSRLGYFLKADKKSSHGPIFPLAGFVTWA